MQASRIIFGAIVSFISFPIILPFLSLIPKLQLLGRLPNATIGHRLVSAITLLVISAYALGFTFQYKPINIVIAFLAVACFLNLLDLIFQLKPRFLAVTLGTIIVLLFGLVGLGSLLALTIDGSPTQFKITSKLDCEVYQFGFASSQGGLDVTLYRKLGLGLNYRVFHKSYLDEIEYPFNNPENACKYAAAKIGI